MNIPKQAKFVLLALFILAIFSLTYKQWSIYRIKTCEWKNTGAGWIGTDVLYVDSLDCNWNIYSGKQHLGKVLYLSNMMYIESPPPDRKDASFKCIGCH